MESINNNQFEVIPDAKCKRKIRTPCANAYLNPALNLLASEDPMCNTALEIVPNKKIRRTKSCEIAVFENTALDLGISKAAINEFLTKELENVKKNMKPTNSMYVNPQICNEAKENISLIESERNEKDYDVETEPVYANLTGVAPIEASITMSDSFGVTNSANTMELSKIEANTSEIDMDSGISIMEQKPFTSTNNGLGSNDLDISASNNITNIQNNVTNHILINNTSNLSLSFIDRLALDSPQMANQSLCLDDDLNESNIMEIKTITIITKTKRIIPEKKKNTNPFLDPNMDENIPIDTTENPFLDNDIKPEVEYNVEVLNRPVSIVQPQVNCLMPRRLFTGDTNSTISTVNESTINLDSQNEYENIDNYRSESPIYENISAEDANELYYNKQSKILGCDVSNFSSIDIMNLNRIKDHTNISNESTDSKNDLKHKILKASKLSKKVLKKIKKTFKAEKLDQNTTLNPYEVPRKVPKQKGFKTPESGVENPALNLNNSDEIEMEELEDDDDEHQYETIKTLRNTRLNTNVTPLRERFIDNTDISQNKTMTPGKKVRFDSTLNREKVITGNSFDCGVQSPGFDEKIDRYHDELENDINERKYLQQNM